MTTTGDPKVVSLPRPVRPESAITDDPAGHEVEFQRGFDVASAYLGSLPRAWARNYAAKTLADGQIPDINDLYERGYRAALYGFLRH